MEKVLFKYIYILQILHGFEGEIPEHMTQGDSKALDCYVARFRTFKKLKSVH